MSDTGDLEPGVVESQLPPPVQPPSVWSRALGLLREVGLVIAMALVLSLLVKTWLFQAFYIPSGSMENTLQVGDRVIVSKLTPRFSELRRGDIVVFSDPGGWLGELPVAEHGAIGNALVHALIFVGVMPDPADEHLIKRVIGLPGDHVTCCTSDGRLSVNGTPVSEPYLYPGDLASTFDFDITVPAGKIWVMGDHRSDSQDSRYHPYGGDGSQGSVSEDLVVGRAVAIVWPLNHLSWLSRPSDLFTSAAPPVP